MSNKTTGEIAVGRLLSGVGFAWALIEAGKTFEIVEAGTPEALIVGIVGAFIGQYWYRTYIE